MRKAMGRSVEAVESAVAQTLDTITAQECANYLTNAGYRSAYMRNTLVCQADKAIDDVRKHVIFLHATQLGGWLSCRGQPQVKACVAALFLSLADAQVRAGVCE